MCDNRINAKEVMESMEAAMKEVAGELDFEADMATDPYDNAHWADRMEEELNPAPLQWAE